MMYAQLSQREPDTEEVPMTGQTGRTTKQYPSAVIRRPPLTAAAILLLSCGVGTVTAKDVHLDADFLTGFPVGTFSNHLDANGHGVSAYGLYGIPRVPFRIGLELGYMVYGSEQRREPLSPTIPETTVIVRTSNRILAGHLLLRLQTCCGDVRPYVDGLLGFNYLYTRTSVKSNWSLEPIAASTNLDDWALSYGAGGGVQILLYRERPQRRKDRPVHILLDAKLRYMRDSPADYLTQGSIRQEGGQLLYYVSNSRTDMLLTQLGITFRF
jgi:hypothetical protein